MKPKKKKQFKKIIFICILLILVLIISIKLIGEKQEVKNEAAENQAIISQQINDYFSDKICPKNTMSLYSNYEGKNSKDDLYVNFKVFIDKLPNFILDIKGKQDSELIEYFEINAEKIYEYLGIQDKEKFLKLAKYIQKSSIDGKKFEYCEVEESSFKTEEEGKYLTFNVKFYFKDTIDYLDLKIFFANYAKTKPQVMYSAIY